MIRNKNIADDAEIAIHKIQGAGYPLKTGGKTLYVDGDNGNDNNDGLTVGSAKKTIQEAVTDAGAFSRIYVFPKNMAAGATDPSSYAETIIIPATHECLQIIGVPYGGRTQGGLPQIKKGAGSTAHLTIRAPGCLIANLGINGNSATGGGILLDDDGSTKTAFGTTITGCHFKNCVGSTATDSRTGGAVQWGSNGGAWQVHIVGNTFYKNVGGIVLLGTGQAVPQDVLIENNRFMGTAATEDCCIYIAGGSGMTGVQIIGNSFNEFPNLSSGSVLRYIDATGCTGSLFNNFFGCLVGESETPKTFGANGSGAKIPTTMRMGGNWGEVSTTGAANDRGEVYRT